ncbi:hypothetical protein CHISP_2230 [Chitinispirillum alkaliphilum]|nr:hypothetical protein CHISP_2230 [Chitinispirillum alkaliphilum]
MFVNRHLLFFLLMTLSSLKKFLNRNIITKTCFLWEEGKFMTEKQYFLVAILVVFAVFRVGAQGFSEDDFGANITLPSFEARVSLGFNYDMLKPPTDVSFHYPVGFFGTNVPLNQNFNLRNIAGSFDRISDSVFNDTTLFRNGEDFQPTAVARQNPNNSVIVSVPMLGGVGSFSYTQNFFLEYETILGNPSIFLSSDLDDVDFILRGTVNVPLHLSLGWETMTFGYAYQVDRNFTFAFNLSRHLFFADLRGRIDADLLGTYNIYIDSAMGSVHGELDYPSERINGYALGSYDAEVWTPTLGLRFWRFSLTSRFGFSTRARGSFSARYSLPAFIYPETFRMKYDLDDPDVLMDPEVRELFLTNAVDSLGYSTQSRLHWKLPHAHTITLDLLDRAVSMSISYTKLFGELEMRLEDIRKEQWAAESGSDREGLVDSLGFDVGVSVDHIIMFHGRYLGAFLNAGVCAIDVRSGERENVLGENVPAKLRMGDAAMLPILNFGSAIGTKIQVLLELNVLPLPAFKTGIYYHF